MAEYLTIGGKLNCEISLKLKDYVILKLQFGNDKPEFKTITNDSFTTVDDWVDNNYGIIKKINRHDKV